MEPRTLALRNGVDLPRVGLGTFRSSAAEVVSAVHAALGCGLRHIDTASIYKNQEAIGRALKTSNVPREQVFVTSKISPYEQGTEKAHAACLDILAKLDTGYVDLVLIHWPGASKTPPDSAKNSQLRLETWRVMEDFYRQGKFKAIGVSNYEPHHVEELMAHAAVAPCVNQFEVHPRWPAVATREACSRNGIAVVAYASLGAGALLQDPVVQAVATKVNRSPAQVLLKWGLQQGCAVIPKSVNPSRIAQFSEQHLLAPWSAQELQVLAQLDALGTAPQKFCWDPRGIV